MMRIHILESRAKNESGYEQNNGFNKELPKRQAENTKCLKLRNAKRRTTKHRCMEDGCSKRVKIGLEPDSQQQIEEVQKTNRACSRVQ
eukprot:1473095-Heterocapsa_arctica.AAC.1